MIHYLIQTIVFQTLFLLVYDLFLKRQTYFRWNRIYLVATTALSFILPFIQLAVIRQNLPDELVIQLPTVLIGSETAASTETSFSVYSVAQWVWLVGSLASLTYFVQKLWRIRRFRLKGRMSERSGYRLVKLPQSDLAFSFLNTIFLGEQLSEENKKSILLHEEVHIRHKHSWDLLYFETLRIVFWFNPIIYLYQNRMGALQEFIADAVVTSQRTKKEYYQNLLSEVFQTENISFINTFFNHSLIKKRIHMLQKSKSRKVSQLRYLLLLPLLGAMLMYTSCSEEVGQDANSTLSEQIADLTAEIKSKENLTEEEKAEIARMILEIYPEDVEGVSGDRAHFKSKIHEDGGKNEFFFREESLNFNEIDKVPVFPGCEGMSGEAAKKCFVTKITEFVVQNFNTKVAGPDVSGKQRIAVNFVVDKDGTVSNVLAKAQDQSLMDEAKRVVQLLPTMVPGEHEGKKVGVQFALPIIFQME